VFNLHRPTAHLYDLDPRNIARDDIPFYRKRAHEIGGSVLELGCGTGRVTLPLLEDGHEVWGLDLSEEMLAQLRGKAARVAASIASRLHVCHGNMARFDLGRTFDLIIAPFRAFQALTDRSQQERCLECIQEHLSAGGQFLMHVFRPYGVLDETWIRPEALDWEVIDPHTGKLVRRYQRRTHIDLARQVLSVDLIYRIEGTAEEIVEPLSLSYFYEDQTRLLLQAKGFCITDQFGYFDGRPITDGPEMIFVCQHRLR
jgi:SAM-dependent methyltransferase